MADIARMDGFICKREKDIFLGDFTNKFNIWFISC